MKPDMAGKRFTTNKRICRSGSAATRFQKRQWVAAEPLLQINATGSRYSGNVIPHVVTKCPRICAHVLRCALIGKLMPATTASPRIPRAMRA